MLNKINIRPRKQILIIYFFLSIVTLVVYWQLNQFDFINLDDNIYITENLHIKSGITRNGISWAFSTRYFDIWNPMVWISFMIDYQLFGLNAGGYHLTNLFLHILSTLLLFWLFNRMTGAVWKSAFVAALFAIHPLHVESVAWISERKDVLSGFFWMLTLCLYVYYTERPVIQRYLFVVFAFILALLSKPMVVTLPAVMMLLDYWPLKRVQSFKGNWILWQIKEKVLFFILSATMMIITIYNPGKLHQELFPLGARISNALVSFIKYITETFLSYDLAVFYPFSTQLPAWQITGATLLIIIITTSVIVMAKRLPYLFVGWFWYAITIIPVIGIIQISGYAMADHYHYLPSMGIAIILAWGIPSLLNGENKRKFLFSVSLVMLFILSVLTWKQCGHWKNSESLFRHALQVTEDNFLAHDNLASVLIKKGSFQEAFYHCNQSMNICPYCEKSYNNRALIYSKYGQHEMAIENYNKAIRLNNNFADAFYNRGIAYDELGRHRLAIQDFKKAMSVNPAYISSFINRGSFYANLGQYKKAIEYYNEAIRFQPYNALIYNNRGAAYLSMGNNKYGCLDAIKGCELGNCTTLKIAEGQGDCF